MCSLALAGASAIAASSALGSAVGCASFHPERVPNAPERAAFAEVDGVDLRYVDVGPRTADAVVLLHGFAASLDTWSEVATALSEHRRVIAVDLMGFGYSGRPDRDYSPSAQARLVYALLQKLDVERIDVVGHSWGSSVALAMAVAEPARVGKVALYDAWVYEEQLPTLFLWSRADGLGEVLFDLFYKERPDDKIALAFYDEKYVTQELVDKVEEQLDRPGTTAAALAAVRGQRFEELERHLAEVHQPVLLLWGREDRVSRLEIGERLHRDLPRSTLVVFPQCGHFPMIEAKAASTRALVDFLEARPTTGAVAPQAPSVEPAASAPSDPSEAEAPTDEPTAPTDEPAPDLDEREGEVTP